MKHKKSSIRSDLSPADLTVASLLAVTWLTMGLLAIVLGVLGGYWVAVFLGVLSSIYGMIWVKVRRTGRQLKWLQRRR